MNFISVKGPELMSMYVGESECGVREVFHKARQAAPCVVLSTRSTPWPRPAAASEDSGVAPRVLSQMLTELDGIEELKGVLVLAATNRRDLIDPALLRPGRFDLQIEFPSPDQAAATRSSESTCATVRWPSGVTARWLAEETEGFSGRKWKGSAGGQ